MSDKEIVERGRYFREARLEPNHPHSWLEGIIRYRMELMKEAVLEYGYKNTDRPLDFYLAQYQAFKYAIQSIDDAIDDGAKELLKQAQDRENSEKSPEIDSPERDN